MLYADYKSNFDTKIAAIKFPPGTQQAGIGCQTKMRPAMPPWVMDWAILYLDGHHIRVKETYRPMAHPHYRHGERRHFCFQYGASTAIDAKGMPRTALDRDTIIRVDCDDFGPHMHYAGRTHLRQEQLTGKFVINEIDPFEFIEAVETFRQSGCPIEDILFFGLKGGK